MRHFKHLSFEAKRSIYVGFLSNEPKLAIAKRLGIDNSTVHYHINKVAHLTEREIIQLITPRCLGCDDGHKSFKCLVCGRAHDNIRSEEFQLIASLREQVKSLKHQLAIYEKNSNPSSPSGPIVTVRL